VRWLPLVALLAGCPTAAGDVVWEDVEPLVRAECAGCHGGAEPEGGFVIDGPASLVDVASTQTEDMPLVTAGEPLQSYLWHKLENTQRVAGGSGSVMPTSGLLPSEDVDLVEAWIAAGAL